MITEEEWQEFFQLYVWQKLQTPDYRLGQALINHFAAVRRIVDDEDGAMGVSLESRLFYEKDDAVVMRAINRLRQNG
jgi:hypothetical protein